MATNYPSGLDTYTNPAGTDALSTGHASQHANVNDAVEAIEAELGTNPSGSQATVKARIEAIETNDWVTTARIANSQVTSAKIADATITGTDIASGTVTSTNILDDTIVNADINASAAIAGTKLADGAITPIKTSGGYVAKTALYTATNDDRVIDCTTGTYTITLPTAASQTGRTFIIRNSGTGTITIGRTGAETISGATSQTLAGYGYLQVVSNGTNWLVLGGTYADEAIGRRIYTWNSAYSSGTGGWQQTYGDTGDRNAAITYTNNWANSYGVDRLRRIGNTVYLVVALDSTNATADAAFTVPSGFRPTLAAITSIAIGGGSNVPRTLSLGSNGVGTIYRAGMTPQGGWQLTVAYPTNDSWPSSLPGTAAGSIPQ
jgi:hypothetical protein